MSDDPKDTLAAKHLREVWGKTVVSPKPTKASYVRYREDESLYMGSDGMITRTFLKRIDKKD